MGAIYRRELMAYFTTPIGYVFSSIFFAISGFMFVFFTFNSGTTDVTMYFSVMIVFFIVLIPLLTMKLFSEERHFESEEHKKAWLIRTTVNISINYLKSAWRRYTVCSILIPIVRIIPTYSSPRIIVPTQ